MKGLLMRSTLTTFRSFAGCLAAAVFGASLGVTAWAQGSATAPPPGTGAPGIINPKRDDLGRQLAEGRLRSAEMDAALESENEKRIQTALVHMKEDFTRIQVLRNDIARTLVARKPLIYELVEEQTAEINRRANELNIYMMARSADDKAPDKPSELTGEEMVGALVKLCKLIDSFTENPTLKNAATLDVKAVDKFKEDKARADKDLLAIIKLSESIKKKSDSLKE